MRTADLRIGPVDQQQGKMLLLTLTLILTLMLTLTLTLTLSINPNTNPYLLPVRRSGPQSAFYHWPINSIEYLVAHAVYKPRYRVNAGGIDDMAAKAPKRPPESSPESSSESGDDAAPPTAPPSDAACDPPDADADDGDGPGKLPKLNARMRPPAGTAGRRWRRW